MDNKCETCRYKGNKKVCKECNFSYDKYKQGTTKDIPKTTADTLYQNIQEIRYDISAIKDILKLMIRTAPSQEGK